MVSPPHRQSQELTDPRALRGLAHPLRLDLLALLRREGPLTATQAGERLGHSAQSCWFHLRQLAKYGLVEQAGGGRGRERPWQATAQATSWPAVAPTPEFAAASELFSTVLAERYFEALFRWLGTSTGEPPEWLDAVHFGDTILYLTPEELGGLKREIRNLLDGYGDRTTDTAKRPPGARLVTFLHLAFPTPDHDSPQER
jgi:hypothetical protein